jgi:hypothetical protein
MRNLKKLAEQSAPTHDLSIGGTDDGCFVDVKQGLGRVRIEPPLDQALDVAASMIFACIPAALRSGYTVESLMEEVATRFVKRVDQAVAATNESNRGATH